MTTKKNKKTKQNKQTNKKQTVKHQNLENKIGRQSFIGI